MEESVYLLYEGDEWLSTDSMVLMGILVLMVPTEPETFIT